MSAHDRIRCLNPRCRRTVPRSRHPDAEEIVCRKCWRNLPQPYRDRYRQLCRRGRRVRRLEARKTMQCLMTASRNYRIYRRLEDACDDNWRRIRAYFVEPERPVGIEGFLREVGLA